MLIANMYVQELYKDDSINVWWGTKIKTIQKIQHNRPDIVVWKIKEKLCFINDVLIGLDGNEDKNYELKHSSYLFLAAELKRLYEHYKFEDVPIVVGATCARTQSNSDNTTILKGDHNIPSMP